MKARIDKRAAEVAAREKIEQKKAGAVESNKCNFFTLYNRHVSDGDIDKMNLEVLKGAYKHMLDHKYTDRAKGKRPTLPSKKVDIVIAVKQLLSDERNLFKQLYDEA